MPSAGQGEPTLGSFVGHGGRHVPRTMVQTPFWHCPSSVAPHALSQLQEAAWLVHGLPCAGSVAGHGHAPGYTVHAPLGHVSVSIPPQALVYWQKPVPLSHGLPSAGAVLGQIGVVGGGQVPD